MYQIQFATSGGPEVLTHVEIPDLVPGAHEVLVENAAVGVNFIDCYQRSGLYPLPLPGCPGVEAVGTVLARGDAVDSVEVGQRVMWFSRVGGAYASHSLVPAANAMPVPNGIADETAASFINKGLTAWYLLHRSGPVKAGDQALIYAAAGGVGQILTQWARALGVRAIAVVGTEQKAEIARACGAEHVLLADADIPACVRELTAGHGVPVVYDSVGEATFFASLDCLARHGTMVTYGNASGPPPAIAPAELAKRGSLKLTRPILFDFIEDRATFTEATDALCARVAAGEVDIRISRTLPLDCAAEAHRLLEARQTTGCTVLLP